MDPIESYYGGEFPERYNEIIDSPMNFGMIISKVVEAEYDTIDQCRYCHINVSYPAIIGRVLSYIYICISINTVGKMWS